MTTEAQPQGPRELDVERRLIALEAFRRQVTADRWSGATLRSGGRPTMPVVDALPTADSSMAYQLVVLRGTPDISYQCLRNSGGTWGWRVLATG